MSSIENQVNIFDQLNNDKNVEQTDYLFVVKGSSQVQMGIEEIFDSNKFDELYAITYVSSPSFFSKYTKKFKKITFILGIDNSDNLEKFASGISLINFIDVNHRIEFWNSLDEDLKKNDK